MRCQFPVSDRLRRVVLLGAAVLLPAGCGQPGGREPARAAAAVDYGPGAIVRPAGVRPPPYRFSAADERLLDEIQRGCFLYFWKEVGSPACLAKDRMKAPVASVAAVGFQLSSLPIGVRRGWVSHAEAQQRALTVLRSLHERSDNKRWGMYLHFPDMGTAGPSHTGFVSEFSTVDTALLLAGVITAGEFFGGQVKALADRMVAEADWKRFAVAEKGFVSMGWQPDDPGDLAGPGKFIQWSWHLASDEERLLYLLAVGSPRPEHALPPETYYRLARHVERHADLPPFVVSWPGNLFTYFFAHCWIDAAGLGPDNPGSFGLELPRVDWWENSRRAALTQRQRCIELAVQYRTFAPDRWGLAPCAARDGYIVPDIQPNLSNAEQLFEGTIAPYGAGSCIMFVPDEAVAALRTFRELKRPDGAPWVWRDPDAGGYGFVDSFNIDQNYASDDYVGIDQGPLLVAIENARTGLIWKLFMANEHVRRALERLRLSAP